MPLFFAFVLSANVFVSYQNKCSWPIRRRHNLWASRADFFSIVPCGVNPCFATSKIFVVLLQHLPAIFRDSRPRDYSKCFATGKVFVVLLQHVPSILPRLYPRGYSKCSAAGTGL
jgi:hypothetical protein